VLDKVFWDACMSFLTELRIDFSKRKSAKLLSIAMAVVAMGVWMILVDPTKLSYQFVHYPYLSKFVGGATVVFGMMLFGLVLQKLISGTPALVLTREGLYDYSTIGASGFIPWQEISRITPVQLRHSNVILVQLHTSGRYLRAGGGIRMFFRANRRRRAANQFTISANALEMDFTQLHSLLAHYQSSFSSAKLQANRY
jgi:hypothetical protein